MRFRKGIRYPHPPRGKARHPYKLSEAALCARRLNLSRSRLRSGRESFIIRLLIWQAHFLEGPQQSQRDIAYRLGVSPSYVCKIQKQRERGLEALGKGRRATLHDLDHARNGERTLPTNLRRQAVMAK